MAAPIQTCHPLVTFYFDNTQIFRGNSVCNCTEQQDMPFDHWQLFALEYATQYPRLYSCLKHLVIPKLSNNQSAFFDANLLDVDDHNQFCKLMSIIPSYKHETVGSIEKQRIVIHPRKLSFFSISWTGNLSQFSNDIRCALADSANECCSITRHIIRILMRSSIIDHESNFAATLQVTEENYCDIKLGTSYAVPTDEFEHVCTELDGWVKQLKSVSQFWPSFARIPEVRIHALFGPETVLNYMCQQNDSIKTRSRELYVCVNV